MGDIDSMELFSQENNQEDNLYARFLNPDPEEPKPEEPDKYKSLFEQQKQELDAMKTDLERTRQMFEAYKSEPVRQPQAETRKPNQNQIFDQLVAEHGVGGAMSIMFEAAKTEAVREARNGLFPVAAQTAQYAIEQYRRSADFVSDDHKKEFDRIVSLFSAEQLASVDPRTIHDQLAHVDSLALGESVKRGRSTRMNEPPPYSRGSNSGGVGHTGSAFAGRRPGKSDADLVRTGLSMGLDEKSIKELIQEAMQEGEE